jgi:signal transduction histidine kinase
MLKAQVRNQIGAVVLVVVALALTVSAVIWKTQELVLDDKVSFLGDAMSKEISPLKRLVQEKILEDKSSLIRFATIRSSNGAGRARGFGAFDVIALLQPGDTSAWSPAWIEKGPEAKAERWPAGHETTMLRGLPFGKLREGEIHWVRLADAQGSPIYALMVPVEIQNAPSTSPNENIDDVVLMPTGSGHKAVVVGLTSTDPLASMTDDYIGSTNTVLLVDDRGYVASHVDKSYLGALFSDDSMIHDLMKEHRQSMSGRFKDAGGKEIIGVYEKISGTNLYAVTSAPISAALAIADTHLRVAVTTALSIGFFCIMLAWFAGLGFSIQETVPRVELGKRSEENEELAATAQAAAPIEDETAITARLSDAKMREARAAAFHSLSKGFAQAVREPILSILAHAQLAKVKSNDAETAAHVASVERDARLTKQIIDRMQLLDTRVDHHQDMSRDGEELDLSEVIENVLSKMHEHFEVEGAVIHRDLEPVAHIRGDRQELEAALEHVIENSLEALRLRSDKRITVRLKMGVGQALLSISDNGTGMTRQVAEQAFEPFYKDFASPLRTGLGLTLVKAITERHSATIRLESLPGEGTEVAIGIPVSAYDMKSFEVRQAPILPVAEEKSEIAEPPAGASFTGAQGETDPSEDQDEDEFTGIQFHQEQSSFKVKIRPAAKLNEKEFEI